MCSRSDDPTQHDDRRDARNSGYREGRATVWREVVEWATDNLAIAERETQHDVPECDICGEPEDHEVGMIANDWNGETGNHRSCEDDE